MAVRLARELFPGAKGNQHCSKAEKEAVLFGNSSVWKQRLGIACANRGLVWGEGVADFTKLIEPYLPVF